MACQQQHSSQIGNVETSEPVHQEHKEHLIQLWMKKKLGLSWQKPCSDISMSYSKTKTKSQEMSEMISSPIPIFQIILTQFLP